eukprot:2191889-Ditylum_brightwellii.AAC.1
MFGSIGVTMGYAPVQSVVLYCFCVENYRGCKNHGSRTQCVLTTNHLLPIFLCIGPPSLLHCHATISRYQPNTNNNNNYYWNNYY